MQNQSLDGDAVDWQIIGIGHGEKVEYFLDHAWE